MRTTDVIMKDFPAVIDLLTYLYADENHEVIVPGMIPGTEFKIKMDEHCNILSAFKPRIASDGKDEFSNFAIDRNITIRQLINVIANLKEMPAVEFPTAFKNRWDEVKTIAGTIRGLNMDRRSLQL